MSTLPKLDMDVRYKVIEVAPVDDSTLEEGVNAWVSEGWTFERVEFVQQPGVRRPVIAYLFFMRKADNAEEGAGEDEADDI